MKVVYASMTGNVNRFAKKLEFETVKIPRRGDLEVSEPFVLITYTTGHGQIPKEVIAFLNNPTNAKNIVAVVGSGNRNWGEEWFCYSAKTISQVFDVPLLHVFENSGFQSDAEIVTEKIKQIKEGAN